MTDSMRIYDTKMKPLINIRQLSEEIGIGVRGLRGFVAARKIPVIRLGHRTMLFDRERVVSALQRYEIPEVGRK